jgi:hypothetical protein
MFLPSGHYSFQTQRIALAKAGRSALHPGIATPPLVRRFILRSTRKA